MNKGVLLPRKVQLEVIEEIRHASYGDLIQIAKKHGLTKARVYYYRRKAGIAFTPKERRAWLATNPDVYSRPRQYHRPIKVVGILEKCRVIDFSPRDVEALRLLGHQQNVVEPLERADLLQRANALDVTAMLTLYQRYGKLRLPLAEKHLTPAERAQLPWLNGATP